MLNAGDLPDGNSPLNMGVPWDALSGGTYAPDYGAQLAGAIAPPQPGPVAPPPGQEELRNALDGMRNFQATLTAQNKAAQTPPQPTTVSTTTKPDGTKELSIKGPAELGEYYGNAAKFYQQALGGYAQQMDQIQQRLRMQEEQARNQPPWVQLATALSANLAQAPNLPGWVQAAGRTAAQLNPRPEEIQARRMGVLGQQAQLAERGMGLEIAQAKATQESHQMAIAAEKERLALVEKARDNIAQDISKGIGTMDAKTASAMLIEAGATGKELPAHLDTLKMLANNIGAKFTVERADKELGQKLAREAEDRRANALTEQVRLGNERNELADTRIKQNEFLNQDATYQKNTAMSTQEQSAVQSAFNVMNLTKKMDDVKVTKSPITGRLEYVNPYRPAEWQQIQLLSNQMLLSGLAGKLGAGVSDRDVTLMRQMVPSGKMTEEQYQATNKVLKSVNADNLQALMRANPNIQQWKSMQPMFKKVGLEKMYDETMAEMKPMLAGSYPSVFGPDRPAIADRKYGPDTKVTAESGSSTQRPTATNAAGEVIEWDGKAWVKKK